MSIQEILLGGGGVLLFVMSVVQIAPIEIKPWSAIARAFGRAINAEVLRDLKTVKQDLTDHIRIDGERDADEHRARILRFNNELLRDIPHTKEEFIDVLADIDSHGCRVNAVIFPANFQVVGEWSYRQV